MIERRKARKITSVVFVVVEEEEEQREAVGKIRYIYGRGLGNIQLVWLWLSIISRQKRR